MACLDLDLKLGLHMRITILNRQMVALSVLKAKICLVSFNIPPLQLTLPEAEAGRTESTKLFFHSVSSSSISSSPVSISNSENCVCKYQRQ